MPDWPRLLERLFTEQFELVVALSVAIGGLILGLTVWWAIRRMLIAAGVPGTVEGTPFERTARRLGTSTVAIVAQLSGLFVFIVALTAALRILGVLSTEMFVTELTGYVPQLFIAALVIIVGLIVGDKAALVVSEYLRSVKVAEVSALPPLVKYSIVYIAGLIALEQLGVATLPLIVLLAAYVFGVVFLGGIAFRDLMTSGAAGIYLLLSEPFSIGDEVEVDGRRGIVQEVDVFVTHIESDDEEFIVPNNLVFRSGIIRVRE